MGDQQQAISLRAQFVGMRNAGLSISEIARQMGVSRPTVRTWLHRFEESGDLSDMPRAGRPRQTSAADDGRILADVHDHPFTNAVATSERLRLGVSARTVRRRLHERGIHHRYGYLRNVFLLF